MTATGQWRVIVENSSMIEMGEQEELISAHTDEFGSLDAALEHACEKRKIYRVTVMGPDGEVMAEDDLARCCALANQKIIWA